MKNRILSMVLCVLMLASMLNIAVFAVDSDADISVVLVDNSGYGWDADVALDVYVNGEKNATINWTPYVAGDVDGDGTFASADATLLMRYLALWDNLGIDEDKFDDFADVYGDNKVNNKDATIMLRKQAGWEGVELDFAGLKDAEGNPISGAQAQAVTVPEFAHVEIKVVAPEEADLSAYAIEIQDAEGNTIQAATALTAEGAVYAGYPNGEHTDPTYVVMKDFADYFQATYHWNEGENPLTTKVGTTDEGVTYINQEAYQHPGAHLQTWQGDAWADFDVAAWAEDNDIDLSANVYKYVIIKAAHAGNDAKGSVDFSIFPGTEAAVDALTDLIPEVGEIIDPANGIYHGECSSTVTATIDYTYHYYTFDMSDISLWKGDILSLRIDSYDNVTAVTGDNCYIAEVIFSKDGTYAETADPAFPSAPSFDEPAWEGEGTEESPYLIGTADDLLAIGLSTYLGDATYEGVYFKQTATIDLEGKDYQSILNFKGTYDGDGYTICNLDQYRALGYSWPNTARGAGLFGSTDGATLKNIVVRNAVVTTVSAGGGVAAIAGNIKNTTVENCHVYGTTINGVLGEGASGTAVLVGKMSGTSTISQCSVVNSVVNGHAKSWYAGVGGLVGSTSNGAEVDCSIENSYVKDTTVTNNWDEEGMNGLLVGKLDWSDHSNVTNCWATGTVNAANQTANGLVGAGVGSGIRFEGLFNLGAAINGLENSNRVIGKDGDEWTSPIKSNLYALESATVNGKTAAEMFPGPLAGVNCTADQKHGATITADAAVLAETYTAAGWSEDVWAFDGENYPTLKSEEIIKLWAPSKVVFTDLTDYIAADEEGEPMITENTIVTKNDEGVTEITIGYTENNEFWAGDPNVTFDIAAFAADNDLDLAADAYRYIIVKVATVRPQAGKRAATELGIYPTTSETALAGVIVQKVIGSDDHYDYHVYDMVGEDLIDDGNGWTGAIETVRVDPFDNETAFAGMTAYIQEIIFSKDGSYNESADPAYPICAATFEGEGTEEVPYLIADAEDLVALSHMTRIEGNNYAGKYFLQTTDIDMADVKGYVSIGTFSGIYDGAGYTISNLTQNTSDDGVWPNFGGGSGLFGSVENGTIKNLTIDNFQIKGATMGGSAAILVTKTNNVQITNCHVINSTLTTNAGGNGANGSAALVAYLSGESTVDQCSVVDTTVNASANGWMKGTGVLVGKTGQGSGQRNTIKNCYVKNGTLNNTADSDEGFNGLIVGLLDWGDAPVVNNCWATGTVNGNTTAGNGLLGAVIGGGPNVAGIFNLGAAISGGNHTNRVVGKHGDEWSSCALVNVYALDSATTNGKTSAENYPGPLEGVNCTSTTKEGDTIDAAAAVLADTYTAAGWSTDVWSFDGTNYPELIVKLPAADENETPEAPIE